MYPLCNQRLAYWGSLHESFIKNMEKNENFLAMNGVTKDNGAHRSSKAYTSIKHL